MDIKEFIKKTIIWGFAFWVMYVVGLIILNVFFVLFGLPIIIIGILIVVRIITKELRPENFKGYVYIGSIWSLMAIILNYLLFAKILRYVDLYYGGAIYLTYFFIFILPIIIGLMRWLREKLSDKENEKQQLSQLQNTEGDAGVKKSFATLGYFLPFLFFLPLILPSTRKNQFSRFHAKQQMILLIFLLESIVAFLMIYLYYLLPGGLGGVFLAMQISLIQAILFLVLMIRGARNASRGNTVELFGKIAIITSVIIGSALLLGFVYLYKADQYAYLCNGVHKIPNPKIGIMNSPDLRGGSDGQLRSNFGKSNKEVFGIYKGGINGNADRCIKIKDADFDTFTVLSREYAKDKNNAYIQKDNSVLDKAEKLIIRNIDSDTFDEVTDNEFKLSKDKNHVYVGTSIIPGADPETFSIVTNPSNHRVQYAKDKNNAYDKQGNVIKPNGNETAVGSNATSELDDTYTTYKRLYAEEEKNGDVTHSKSKRFSDIDSIKKTVENMLVPVMECDKKGGNIKSTNNGIGLVCSSGAWNWPTLNACGEKQADTNWFAEYDNNDWSYTLSCKNYPECSGVENVRCTKDDCVFSERCN